LVTKPNFNPDFYFGQINANFTQNIIPKDDDYKTKWLTKPSKTFKKITNLSKKK